MSRKTPALTKDSIKITPGVPYVEINLAASPYWQIRYGTSNGTNGRYSTKIAGIENKEAAGQALYQFIASGKQDELNGKKVKAVESANDPTFEQIWDRYCEMREGRNSDRGDRKYLWRVFEPFWAAKRMSEIDETTISEYVRLRTSGEYFDRKACSLHRVNTDLAMIKAAFRAAAKGKNALISKRDIPDISPEPIDGKPRKIVLSELQIRKLFDFMRAEQGDGPVPPIHAYVYLAVMAGARMEAILQLTWDRVHLDAEMPYLNFVVPGMRVTKKRRNEEVPMMPRLLEVLTAMHNERGLVRAGSEKVVKIGYGTVYNTLRYLGKRAGLTIMPTPMVLRKSGGSLILNATGSREDGASFLGNSPAVFDKHYGKEALERKLRVVSQVGL